MYAIRSYYDMGLQMVWEIYNYENRGRRDVKKVISLSVSDLRNIVRDPILVLSMLGPLVIAAGFKFALPVAAELVKKQFAFDISVYMDFIMGLRNNFV